MIYFGALIQRPDGKTLLRVRKFIDALQNKKMKQKNLSDG